MAGEWIKMRAALLNEPEVLIMATILVNDGSFADWAIDNRGGPCRVSFLATKHIVVSGVLQVWGYANFHAEDELLPGFEVINLDDVSGVPGLGQAMVEVGWAMDGDDGVYLPGFLKWNAPYKGSSRDRAATAKRVARHRAKAKEALHVPLQTPLHPPLHAVTCTSESASDVFSSPDGEEGQNGALHPAQALELAMDGNLAKLLKVVQPWLLCSPAKARDCLCRWRQPVAATWEAWRAYERVAGTEKARIAALTVAHPDLIPLEVPRKSPRELEKEATVAEAMRLLRAEGGEN